MPDESGDVYLASVRFDSPEKLSDLEERAPTVARNHRRYTLPHEIWREESAGLRNVALDVGMDVDKTGRHGQTSCIDNGSGFCCVKISDARDASLSDANVATEW
jgi:hypothetical protein